MRKSPEEYKLRKHLKTLTSNVGRFLYLLDQEMLKPSTPERGKRIAERMNELNFANDQARYFGLGIDFRKDTPARKAKEFGTPGWNFGSEVKRKTGGRS